MKKSKIIIFAGSARKTSFNKKLAQAATQLLEEHAVDAEYIDLADYPMPLFDEDVEAEGTPEAAQILKAKFADADGFIITSPEYNSSVSPLLKNTIDWLSREAEGYPMLAAFSGKTAALLSTSPGPLGGMRGLVHLRDILGNIGVLVIPQEKAVRSAYDAFDDTGALSNPRDVDAVKSVVAALVEVTNARVNF